MATKRSSSKKKVRKPTTSKSVRKRTISPGLEEWVRKAMAYGRFIQTCARVKAKIGAIVHHDHHSGESHPV